MRTTCPQTYTIYVVMYILLLGIKFMTIFLAQWRCISTCLLPISDYRLNCIIKNKHFLLSFPPLSPQISNGNLSVQISSKLFSSSRIRERQDLQMRQPEVPEAYVLHIGGLLQGRFVPLFAARMFRPVPTSSPRQFRRLPRPRHSHGHHAQRRRRHGRCSSANSRFAPAIRLK